MKLTLMLSMKRAPAIAIGQNLSPFRRVLMVWPHERARFSDDGQSRAIVALFSFGQLYFEVGSVDGDALACIQFDADVMLGEPPWTVPDAP